MSWSWGNGYWGPFLKAALDSWKSPQRDSRHFQSGPLPSLPDGTTNYVGCLNKSEHRCPLKYKVTASLLAAERKHASYYQRAESPCALHLIPAFSFNMSKIRCDKDLASLLLLGSYVAAALILLHSKTSLSPCQLCDCFQASFHYVPWI